MNDTLISEGISRNILFRDPYLITTLIAMVLVSIPLILMRLNPSFLIEHYDFYFDAPILFIAVLSLWSARKVAVSHRATRFWFYIALGFAFWLSVRLSGPLLMSPSPVATLMTDLLYLAFYLFLILAFQLRPHIRWREQDGDLLRQLESTGATIFCFGLLIYFIIIPVTYDPNSLATNIPSATLYSLLNLYLLACTLQLRSSWKHEPWRGCYDWLVLATLGFVLLDGFDLATRVNDRLDNAVSGTLIESLWLIPTLGFVIAARIFVQTGQTTQRLTPEQDLSESVWKWRGTLTYFALVPAVIHISMDLLGWSDEKTRAARDLLVILWIATAAVLSFLYDRRLLVERQSLEVRHREARLQLEMVQRMDAVRRMAGGVAHDFNNLLMVIQGFADVLVSRMPDGQDRRDAEQISKASQRAGNLTRKLLTLGSNEGFGLQPFQPNQVLQAMTRTFESLSGVQVTLQLTRTGYVLGDRASFEDAVLNLVLNAREASPEGGNITVRTGKRRLTADEYLIDTLQPGNYGVIEVEDRGRGMEEETRRHVFEPFFSNREGGTGLGLSMVYSFAHEAGGTVEVESCPGEGSLFRLFLPECDPPEMPDQEVSAKNSDSSAGGTVLLVEDEGSVRQVLKESLENAGFSVVEAVNGAEALKIVQDSGVKFELVITDVVMPEMDGSTLALRIGEMGASLPIIFMTGHSAGQFDQSHSRDEDHSILRKPFAASELLAEIERRLKQTAR